MGIGLNAQITHEGINQFRIGQSLIESEKIVGKPIKLKLNENEWGYFSEITDNGIPLKLVYADVNYDEGNSNYVLYKVSTTSEKIRTVINLGVGSDLEELWEVYKNATILLSDFDQSKNPNEKIRVFSVKSDINKNTITKIEFYLKSNKVYKVNVSVFEE